MSYDNTFHEDDCYDNLILGEDCVYSTNSKKTGLNNNIAIVGPSGAGKSMSITIPNMLHSRHQSMIISVTKRKIVDEYKGWHISHGYNVEIVDFVHPELSTAGFEPLRYAKNEKDLSALIESIVMMNPRKQKSHADPYWDDSSESTGNACAGAVKKSILEPTLADVADMIAQINIQEGDDAHIKTNYDAFFDAIEAKEPGGFISANWKTFRSLPIKTAGCVYSSLATTFDKIMTPQLKKMMRMPNQIDFRDLADRKTILFVITSPIDKSLNKFVKLFFKTAMKELFEYAQERIQNNYRLPVPVQLVFDDFATGGIITDFPEYISIFREAGISATLLLQSESQLAAMYGEGDSTTILNNCDTYVYMGGNDYSTAKNISMKMNVPLDDILFMPVGEVIIFRRGHKPVRTRRYKIFEDPEYIANKNKQGYDKCA